MNAQPLARLAQAFLVMFAMTIIVFIGIHWIGNPVDILISPEADQMERDRMMSTFGMDQALWMQYGIFLVNALQRLSQNSFDAFGCRVVVLAIIVVRQCRLSGFSR